MPSPSQNRRSRGTGVAHRHVEEQLPGETDDREDDEPAEQRLRAVDGVHPTGDQPGDDGAEPDTNP